MKAFMARWPNGDASLSWQTLKRLDCLLIKWKIRLM